MTSRATSESPDQPRGAEVIDERAALDRIGGDRQLLRELALIFVEDGPQLMSQLTASLADGDRGRSEHFAHGLRGIAANVGGVRVEQMALVLENAAREGQLPLATVGLKTLATELNRLIEALQATLLSERFGESR